jgi:glutamyl-tRNA synthetase
MASTVRTRIAPSPTGFPHIGTIYQVLIDFAYAHKHHGKFILRLEDTDRARFVEGAEDVIYQSLTWFGLEPDESPKIGGPFAPYRQSERLPIYKKYAEELIAKGHAYYCFCTRERLEQMRENQEAAHKPPMYDKTCLKLSAKEVTEKLDSGIPHVVRLKVPEHETIAFDDIISGHIVFDSDVIDHQVLMKSDGFPTYHFGVVVDDHLMEITHIFRGKEWIPSTPKHVLIYKFFGWDMPIHGHLPLILNEDGKGKLSKRHGHASVDYYRKLGYLPEAVLNYLSNIVWNHPEGKDLLLYLTSRKLRPKRHDSTSRNWTG